MKTNFFSLFYEKDLLLNDNEFRASSAEIDFNKEIETPTSFSDQRPESSSSVSSGFYHPNHLPQYRNLNTQIPTRYQISELPDHQLPNQLPTPPPSYSMHQMNTSSSDQQHINHQYHPFNFSVNINLQK